MRRNSFPTLLISLGHLPWSRKSRGQETDGVENVQIFLGIEKNLKHFKGVWKRHKLSYFRDAKLLLINVDE